MARTGPGGQVHTCMYIHTSSMYRAIYLGSARATSVPVDARAGATWLGGDMKQG